MITSYVKKAIPDSWEKVKIGSICDLKNGYAFKPSDWTKNGLKIVRIQNLNNSNAPYNHFSGTVRERFIIHNGDLLFAWSGTPGTSFGAHIWNGEKAVLNQHIFRVDFDEKIIFKRYFFYAINQKLNELIDKAHGGVGLRHVTKGKFEETKIELPPLSEQRRIVAKIEELFSELDKGIECLKTARGQLKIYRQVLLKHAFEGKLTAQWREENKDGSGPLKADSVPITWRWSCVGDLLLEGPSNGRSVKDRADGFPVLRLTALKNGRIDLSEFKHGDWDRKAALPFVVKAGDFLLSRGNGSKHLVGRGGVVPDHQGEIAYPDTMVRLRVDPQRMRIDFFRLLWESRLVRNQIESAARTTAGIYKINQRHIEGFRVPVPDLDEQQIIVDLLEEKLSIVEQLENELEIRLTTSETLRQSILKKAFSGQLVPQDPNDEPASVLLERILAEKATQSSHSRRSRASRKQSRKTTAQTEIDLDAPKDESLKSQLYVAFENAGLIGCIDTNEQLSSKYKSEMDFTVKHRSKE